MKRYCLDTNAVSDTIHRRRGVDQRVRQARAAGHIVGTAMPALAELLGGVEAGDTRDRNRPIVARGVKLFRLWPFFEDAAQEYARCTPTSAELAAPSRRST